MLHGVTGFEQLGAEHGERVGAAENVTRQHREGVRGHGSACMDRAVEHGSIGLGAGSQTDNAGARGESARRRQNSLGWYQRDPSGSGWLEGLHDGRPGKGVCMETGGERFRY
eukprot:982747-Rhodomonas_salina.7